MSCLELVLATLALVSKLVLVILAHSLALVLAQDASSAVEDETELLPFALVVE